MGPTDRNLGRGQQVNNKNCIFTQGNWLCAREQEHTESNSVLRWTEKRSPKWKVLRTARKSGPLRMEVTEEYQSHCNTVNTNHKHLHLHHDLVHFLPWKECLGSRFLIASLVVVNWFCLGTAATDTH